MSGRIALDFPDRLAQLTRDVAQLQRQSGVGSAQITDEYEGVMRVPTMPPRSLPTAPPAEAPVLTVTGSKEGMTILASGTVAPTTTLDYYLDGVLVVSTKQTVLFWTTESDGSPMNEEGTYTWRVFARNELGGVWSEPISGGLDPLVDSRTVLGWVSAGYVLAGVIEVGSNIVISPDEGIAINLANGGVIHFPSDGSDAIVDARLRTSELDVEGTARFSGTARLEGVTEIPAGIGPPASAPAVTPDWADPLTQTPFDTLGQPWAGLWDDGSTWLSVTTAAGVSSVYSIDKTNPATRTKLFDLPTGGTPLDLVANATHVHVLVIYGSGYYLWRFTRAGGFVASRLTASTSLPRAGLVRSATGGFLGVLFSYTPEGGTLYLQWLENTDALAKENLWKIDTGWTKGRAITGALVTAADFGLTRLIVTHASGANVYTYGGSGNATQSKVDINCWSLPEPTTGISYDGSNFRAMAGGLIRRFSTAQVVGTRIIGSTNVDSNPLGTGQHRSTLGKTVTYRQPARSWFRVAIPEPRPNPGVDEPDTGAIYIDNKHQVTLPTGELSRVFDLPAAGAVPPATNEFDGVPGVNGTLRNTGGTFKVMGNQVEIGSFIKVNPDGSDALATGDVSVASGVTGAGNWPASRVTQADYARRLGVWQLWLTTSPAVALDFSSNPNYTNQTIATLPVAARPRRRAPFVGRWNDSNIAGVVDPSGDVIITGGVPRAYAAGDTVEISATCID